MDTDQPGAETGAAGTPSIEDTLSAAFDQAQESETTDQGGEQDDNSGETAAAKEAAPADTETPPEEGAETTDADSTKDAGAAETPLSPPERWSAADKEQFKALPPEAQKLVLKREGDVERYLTQETQKIAETKRNYEPLERHIAPRREAWALQGFTPDAALEHLFALSDFATRDKPGFIRWFAQQQGVDLSELASSGASAPDPQIQALSQEVQSLKQADQQRQQQARDTYRQSVNSAIQEFAQDTKSHPHFKDVEADIAAMLPGIMQQKPGASHKELLQIAYDKATWANDGVRTKILAEQKKAEDLKAAQAAEKAKKAAGGNVKTSGSLPDGRRKLTMDETLAAAYDQANARA